MAVFGISGAIPWAVGPLLAGMLMDNADPRWLWYTVGVVGLVAAGAFALLQRRDEQATAQVAQRRDSMCATSSQ